MAAGALENDPYDPNDLRGAVIPGGPADTTLMRGEGAAPLEVGVVDWDNITDPERMALSRGARVRLPSGEVVTLRGSPYADNSRQGDRRGGPGINLREPNATDAVGAFASAATEQVPFADEAATGLSAMLSGRGYSEERQRVLDQRDRMNQTDRGSRVAGGLTGFATSLAAPGGAFIGRGGTIANRALRGFGVGSAMGAAYGAGAAEGGVGERAIGAGQGALLGGGIGAAAPVAGAVGAFGGRAIGRTLSGAWNNLLDQPQGAEVVQRNALSALQRSLAADGVTPDVARRVVDEWEATGVMPNVVDITPRGGQTQRLLRGAAARSGPASNAAESYLETQATNIQDNAINLTRRLTPETRTAQEVTDALSSGRSAQAEADYLGPYRAQIPVDESITSALADEPGRAALRRARAAAVTRRNYDQVAEIDALLSSEAPPPSASAGTLDRARIAMAGRGRNLMTGSNARPDVAGGLFDRANDLDRALDAVPAIQPARETYRRFSEGIEGVDLGSRIRTEAPDALEAQLASSQAGQFTAPVGAARALETAIGTRAEGQTGLLNTLATSPNMRRNIPAVFGEGGRQYQAGLGNLIDQLNAARFIASSQGSKTAGVATDLVQGLQLPTGPISTAMMALDRLMRGLELSPGEAEALMTMAQQPALTARGLFGGSRARNVSGYAVPTTAALLGTQPAR